MELDHRQLEKIERAAWVDLHAAAPAALKAEYGLSCDAVGSGIRSLASGIDVLAFNRTFGVGVDEPATERFMDETIERYRQAEVPRFFVQVMPESSPRQLPHWLLRRGFARHNNWVKLTRNVDPPVRAETTLRVALIGASEAHVFGTIAASCFEWPQSCGDWVAATVGRPGWAHWMAYDKDHPVATAALFADGEWAWMDLAATLPEARSRGAQSALMGARIDQAKKMGCRYLVVETGEDTPERPSRSFRNMQRLNFQVAYVRPNYLYHHA